MKQFTAMTVLLISVIIGMLVIHADKIETSRTYNAYTRISTINFLDGHTEEIDWAIWWGDKEG